MKLFLTSAGLGRETTKDFIKVIEKDPKHTRVCFIPTAAGPEINKDFLEKDQKRLRELGCKITEIDLVQENKNSLYNKLKNFDVILVGGGNTFYLLKYVRKSGFDKIIISLLRQGKIYFGISAGSIIAGPNIEIANWKSNWDKNIVHLKNLSGINLVPFAVSPHFVEKDRKLLEKKSKEIDYPIVVLNDKQAIIVCGSKVKIIGKGKKVSFYGKNPLSKQ